MSPTVFRSGKFRGYFLSREELRMHVHVACADGEAKFWLEPILALASHTGLRARDLAEMQQVVEVNHAAIVRAWRSRFGPR